MFSRSRGICEAEGRPFKNTGAARELSLRGFVGGYLALHRPPRPARERTRRPTFPYRRGCKVEHRLLTVVLRNSGKVSTFTCLRVYKITWRNFN